MKSPLSQENFSLLLDKIYDASLDPSLWIDFMSAVRQIFKANGSTFWQVDAQQPELTTVDIEGYEFTKELRERQFTEDYWYLEGKKKPSGSVIIGSEIVSIDKMHRAPIYQEVFRDMDVEYLLASNVYTDSEHQCLISFLRGKKDDDFSSDYFSALEMIMPHLQKGYRIQRQLANRDSYRVALDASPYGIVILDSMQHVVYFNPKAEHIFQSQDGISLSNGLLKIAHYETQKQLNSSVHDALAPLQALGQNRPSVLSIPRRSGKLDYQIEVCRLNALSDTIQLMANAACLLFIHDPVNHSHLSQRKLQILYKLTSTEAQICASLFDGLSLQETADKFHISRNTAKTHLRHIFSKCQVSSQPELIRLLALGIR